MELTRADLRRSRARCPAQSAPWNAPRRQPSSKTRSTKGRSPEGQSARLAPYRSQARQFPRPQISDARCQQPSGWPRIREHPWRLVFERNTVEFPATPPATSGRRSSGVDMRIPDLGGRRTCNELPRDRLTVDAGLLLISPKPGRSQIGFHRDHRGDRQRETHATDRHADRGEKRSDRPVPVRQQRHPASTTCRLVRVGGVIAFTESGMTQRVCAVRRWAAVHARRRHRPDGDRADGGGRFTVPALRSADRIRCYR